MALAIFEVMRALETRSPKQMPAPHRLVLLVLADHARDSDRAWPSVSRLVAMTGLSRSTVITCLNELEAAGWIERQGLAPAGPGGRASTMYVVRGNGGDIGRAPKPTRETGTGPGAGPVQDADPSDSRTRPGAGRQGSGSWTSGVRELDVRGPGAGPKSLRESPMESPSEDHPPAGGCAQAGAARGDGSDVAAAGASAVATAPPASEAPDLGDAPVSDRPAEACAPPPATAPKPAVAPGLFPGFDSVAPALPPAKAARRTARRPRPAPDGGPPVKKAEVRYAEAYARGQCSVSGEPFAPPTDSHAEYIFRSALKVYALGTDGQPLRAEPLDAWIEASSAEYRRATGIQPQYQGGFHPRKWVEWLGAGKPTSCAGNRRAPRVQGGRIDDAELEAQQLRRAADLGLHLEQDGI